MEQKNGVSSTVIKNVKIITGRNVLSEGWIAVRGERIVHMGAMPEPLPEEAWRQPEATIIDGEQGWLVPGFIDVHVHGGAGCDFTDATTSEELDAIARFHACNGTTSMLATTMTASRATLEQAMATVHCYRQQAMPYAQILGIHLEGPFISQAYAGAQNPRHIANPRLAWLDNWLRRFPGLIKMQTLAPELEGAPAYITRLREAGIVPACGHTNASYEETMEAARQGMRHAVHLFNAMRPFHHREPGALGAVLTDSRFTAELIADGHHVHPAGIALLLQAMGAERLLLITDAISAAGLPDGHYTLSGLDVTVTDGIARLTGNGRLAGSTLTMLEAFRYVIREAGVGIVEASRMASANPARLLGLQEELGSLSIGRRADMLLLDRNLELAAVWVKGNRLPLSG